MSQTNGISFTVRGPQSKRIVSAESVDGQTIADELASSFSGEIDLTGHLLLLREAQSGKLIQLWQVQYGAEYELVFFETLPTKISLTTRFTSLAIGLLVNAILIASGYTYPADMPTNSTNSTTWECEVIVNLPLAMSTAGYFVQIFVIVVMCFTLRSRLTALILTVNVVFTAWRLSHSLRDLQVIFWCNAGKDVCCFSS